MLAEFALAILLVAVHAVSKKFVKTIEKFHIQTISFSAGLFLGLIFLELLPETFAGTRFIGDAVFILMAAGFVLFHVGEKYLYQHVKNKDELLKDLSSVHAVGFFVDHFVVGIMVFLVFSYDNIFASFILFIPLLLHSFSSALSLNHLDKHFPRKSIAGFLMPLAPVFGVSFAAFLNLNPVFYFGLLAFAVGAMLYISIRDMLPRGESGKPFLFLLGALISILAVLLPSML